MSDSTTAVDEDEAIPERRPRTMRRAAEDEPEETAPPRRARRVAEDDPEPEPDEAPEPEEDPADDDEAETDEPRKAAKATIPPIRGGWTEGQKTMDAASDFAQVFQPEQHVQVIAFLEDQPYANYRRHWVDRIGPKGAYKRPYVCLETVNKACPLCDIGDKPQAVSAFNVAILGDDGQSLLKTWDVGAKLFNVLKGYATDPKVGPLTKGYFAVSKTGKSGRGGSISYNVIPVRARDLTEDYDIPAPDEAEIKAMDVYDTSILQIPKRSELEEIAEEMADED